MPVLGPGICAMYVASLIASRFSILVPVGTSVSSTMRQAEEYGLRGKVASVRSLDVPVFSIGQDRERAVEMALKVAGECVERDGAEVVALGCMSMAFQRLDADLEEVMGVRG